MLAELAAVAPQFLQVTRGFGRSGIVPADLMERILPPS